MRLPAEAMAYYLSLGEDRTYAAVAERYGISRTTVAKRAAKENWQREVEDLNTRLRARAAREVTESLDDMNVRHLKLVKVIQGKALEALKRMPLASAMDAVRALDKAIAQERLIRGEPTERTALSIEDVIKREYDRWMAVEVSGADAGGDFDEEDGDGTTEQDGVLP